MMELLYATGVRRAELAGISIFELDTQRQTLTVRQGKGKRDRMIPMGERAAAWCARYLADARPKLAIENERGPDDDLRLQFEATTRLSAEAGHSNRTALAGVCIYRWPSESLHRLGSGTCCVPRCEAAAERAAATQNSEEPRCGRAGRARAARAGAERVIVAGQGALPCRL